MNKFTSAYDDYRAADVARTAAYDAYSVADAAYLAAPTDFNAFQVARTAAAVAAAFTATLSAYQAAK